LGIDRYISISENVKEEISKANEYYNEKEFEYFGIIRVFTGYKNLPDFVKLREFTSKLITKLEDIVMK